MKATSSSTSLARPAARCGNRPLGSRFTGLTGRYATRCMRATTAASSAVFTTGRMQSRVLANHPPNKSAARLAWDVRSRTYAQDPVRGLLMPSPCCSIPDTGRSSPLGATISDCGVNFSVFFRSAGGVELLFFDRADSPWTASGLSSAAWPRAQKH